jgi:AraC-like DNA-binding protein
MTKRVLILLRREGKGVDGLGLPVEELQNPEARIDIATVDHLIEVAASLLGASGLGQKIAAVFDADTYDAAGRVMLTGRTLREAFALAFKHQRLWGDTDRFSMRAEPKLVRFGFEHPGESALAKGILAELALVEVMRGAKALVSPEAAAVEVRFAHRPFGRVDDLKAVFGCDVTFGARRAELALPIELANAPLRVPVDLLRAVLEHDAAAAEAKLPEQISIVDRARVAARDFPPLRELARRLKLSARTLQRKLGQERSSYFEVIDAIRREAVARLTAQGLAEKNIALEVGFGDDRALARARRRWGARRERVRRVLA